MSYREQLTAEEVAFFHENGYLAVRGVVPPAVLETVRRGAEALQARYADYRRENKVFYTSAADQSFDDMMTDKPGEDTSGRVLWRVDELEERMPEVAALKRLRFVHNAMGQLLGDQVVQYNESFVTKPPRIGMPVYWHQDPSFKRRIFEDVISTCDIYLDKADESNGCIWVVPGSHKRGVIAPQQIKAWMDACGFEIPGAAPVRMEPGDVAFHNNGCLHGSSANPSDRERRIVYLAFQTRRQAEGSGQVEAGFIEERVRAMEGYRREAFGGGGRGTL